MIRRRDASGVRVIRHRDISPDDCDYVLEVDGVVCCPVCLESFGLGYYLGCWSCNLRVHTLCRGKQYGRPDPTTGRYRVPCDWCLVDEL